MRAHWPFYFPLPSRSASRPGRNPGGHHLGCSRDSSCAAGRTQKRREAIDSFTPFHPVQSPVYLAGWILLEQLIVLLRIFVSPRDSLIVATSAVLPTIANVSTTAFACCVHSSIEASTRRPGVKSSKLMPQPRILTAPVPESANPSLQR